MASKFHKHHKTMSVSPSRLPSGFACQLPVPVRFTCAPLSAYCPCKSIRSCCCRPFNQLLVLAEPGPVCYPLTSQGAADTRRSWSVSALRCSTSSFAPRAVLLAAASPWSLAASKQANQKQKVGQAKEGACGVRKLRCTLHCSTASCAFKDASSTAEFEESTEMSARLV